MRSYDSKLAYTSNLFEKKNILMQECESRPPSSLRSSSLASSSATSGLSFMDRDSLRIFASSSASTSSAGMPRLQVNMKNIFLRKIWIYETRACSPSWPSWNDRDVPIRVHLCFFDMLSFILHCRIPDTGALEKIQTRRRKGGGGGPNTCRAFTQNRSILFLTPGLFIVPWRIFSN